ncbi:MAG: type II toxin-antitoxin system VapC family toxin [Campylobacteraceae bacterium]|nr:type II toxin-antitoxin system VapC family toxin [Campylobacteraceae bacterium]
MTEKSDKYLIDSNIIIYHLNGENVATEFLKNNINRSSISRRTFIEVLSFDFTEDQKKEVINLLRRFEIIDTTDAIAMQALENNKLKKIKLADNIIASTTQVNGLVLVTRNVKDFNSIDIKVLNIFDLEK